MGLAIVEKPPPQDPLAAPRPKPLSTAKVYGTLAAVALGIIAIMATCCATWLYYVEVRGQR